MRLALAEARLALACGEVPVGAVVVCRGAVLARTHNRREELKDPTAHAEILALRQAAGAVEAWRLQECVIYVTLEPCPMCAGALVQGRVKRLVYGAPDPRGGAAGSVIDLLRFTPFNHQVEVTGGILAGECRGLLESFFKARRDG